MAGADAERKAVVEARNEGDSTVYQTEKTLLEHKAKVPQEDQDVINADIAALKEALADENVAADVLKEKVEKLKQSSMKIGEAMYKNTGGDGGDGGDGGTQGADYEDVKKEGDDKDKK